VQTKTPDNLPGYHSDSTLNNPGEEKRQIIPQVTDFVLKKIREIEWDVS